MVAQNQIFSPNLLKRPPANPGKMLVKDEYLAELEELFLLRNPKYRFQNFFQSDYVKFLKFYLRGRALKKVGRWFYFPWLNEAVHYLPEREHLELRTARNKNLITSNEQLKFYNSVVGVMGLSVGSHAALTIGMAGGGNCMKLADPDIISGSNLNRIRTGYTSLGIKKAVWVARQIYEINPYSKLEVYPEGINDTNLKKFLLGPPKIDVLIEEMDSPYFKLKARYFARKFRIPVIMAADNGDNIIVDVERFDLAKKIPILHGILGDVRPEEFLAIPPHELPQKIARIAGANLATPRMLESVLEVGKTLYSWPQLGNAATLCGATLAYLARKIILKQNLKSGRYEVNLDSIFEQGYFTKKRIQMRRRKLDKLLKKLDFLK